MPKKANNKTAHVLNLLTNAPDDPAVLEEDGSEEKSAAAKKPAPKSAPKASGKIEIENKTADPVSDIVRETLEKAYTAEQSATVGDEMLDSTKGTRSVMSDELLTRDLDGNDLNPEDYITVNIVEDVVKAKAREFMKKIGGCDCHRCVNDVIAIALNELPSKYTVTHKGMLFAKMTSYENQNTADISSALTKACLMVASAPRH